MNYKNNKKHITALLAAMAIAGTSSVFAATFGSNLQDNNQSGTTYVSAQDGDTIRFGQLDTSFGGGAALSSTVISPDLTSGASNTDYVYTSLNSVTPDQTTTLQGGLAVDPSTGNTTVAQGGSQTASLSSNLIRVRRIEVYNQTELDPAKWGQAVNPIGETQYGYVDASGNFQQVNLSPAAVTALDAFVSNPIAPNAAGVFAALSPADITALGSLYSPGTLIPASNTGNLTVEGVTSTKGITNTGAISTGSLTIGGVAAATVNDVTTETNDRITADNFLNGKITTETNDRIAADNVLDGKITAEAATRLSEDTKLQANIDAEVAARIADVNAEETRARAAEVALAGRATALETRATSLESRSTALEGRMGRAESDIRSLRKGIAMSAALQTPVINDGDKQAVKVGAATYDGEQGLGLGYARRVNDSVTVNVDVATGFPETVARGGVNLSF